MRLRLRKLRSRRQRRQIAAVLVSPEGLLAPLNRARQSQRTKELVELLRNLQEIWRLEAAEVEVERLSSQELDHDPVGARRAHRDLYVRANEILSRCHWSPRVSGPPNLPFGFAWNARREQSDWENRFVFWMLNQRASGEISLVRACRNCGRWFYAATNHQTYCGDRCRQQFHSRDQRFKEQRRLYMRRYRAMDKARQAAREFAPGGKRHGKQC
jgi:hypothetical protein